MRAGADPAAPVVSAGLDGCRRGWVLAVLGSPAAPLVVTVHDRFGDAMAAADAAGAVAVGADIPIGLPADGRRIADGEARRLLGPRRGSVFPTPCRVALHAEEYGEALVRSRAVSGKGLSKQAWNLIPKMREVDAWVRPHHAAVLFEVHPELAFARLAGAPLEQSKKTAAGLAARGALLRHALEAAGTPGAAAAAALRTAAGLTGRGVLLDDVWDAVAVACSARSIARGSGVTLGDGACDERGLVMRICY